MVYLIKECVKINLKQLPLIVAQKNAKFVRDRHIDLQKDRQSQKQTHKGKIVYPMPLEWKIMIFFFKEEHCIMTEG